MQLALLELEAMRLVVLFLLREQLDFGLLQRVAGCESAEIRVDVGSVRVIFAANELVRRLDNARREIGGGFTKRSGFRRRIGFARQECPGQLANGASIG